jgi:hypothetical protein
MIYGAKVMTGNRRQRHNILSLAQFCAQLLSA